MASPTGVVIVDLTEASANDADVTSRKRGSTVDETPTPKKLKSNLESTETKVSNGGDDSERNDAEMHHPGELRWDMESDCWNDWDHGEIETNSNRREYPEGFYWTCCGDIGTAKGCTKGKDKFNGDLNARYPDSEPPTDDEGHPGELEVNWDCWNNYYGNPDTNTNRREFPEGFTWSCCGQPGGSPGCEKDDVTVTDDEKEKEEEDENK